MSTWLTLYVLVWPVLVAATLFVIVRAFVNEWRESRDKGEQII